MSPDQFFGKLLFDKLQPRVGIHYDAEALESSLDYGTSQIAISTILGKMLRKAVLVEIGTGIGVFASYAANRTAFLEIISIEANMRRQAYAQAITAASSNSSKIRSSTTFTQQLDATQPHIFLFNTVPMQGGLVGVEQLVTQQVMRKDQFGRDYPAVASEVYTFPIEQAILTFMGAYSFIDLFTVIAPKGYSFPGFTAEHRDLIDMKEEAISESKSLFIITRKGIDKIATDEETEWRTELFKKLRELLLKIFPTKAEFVSKVLQSRHFWEKAFTHASVGADNYEVMESTGDVIINREFVLLLIERYPDVREENFFAELKNYYASKDIMGELGRKHGLDKLVRAQPEFKDDISVAEDVFEAFFAALYQSALEKEPAAANGAVKAAARYFYPEGSIDLERAKGPTYTRYKNLIEMGLYEIGKGLSKQDEDGSYVYTIYAPNHRFNRSKDMKLLLGREILATAKGDTKTKAQHNAAEKAIQELARHGITAESLNALRDATERQHQVLGPLIKSMHNSMKKHRFIDVEFKHKSKDRSRGVRGVSMTMTLRRSDGSYYMPPQPYAYASSREEAKIRLIQEYLAAFPV